MPGLLDSVDPAGLPEYSVVYTDRVVNWFSFRWSQILDTSGIAAGVTVMNTAATDDSELPSYAPAAANKVCERILAERPGVVFAHM